MPGFFSHTTTNDSRYHPIGSSDNFKEKLNKPIDLNKSQKKFTDAAKKGNTLELEEWLKEDWQYLKTEKGVSWGLLALVATITENKLDCAKLLMQYDINPNEAYTVKKSKHRSPLHEATAYGRVEIARLLIKHGANTNAQTGNGNTPLHFACERDQKEIIEALIEGNSQLSIKNKKGQLPPDLLPNSDWLGNPSKTSKSWLMLKLTEQNQGQFSLSSSSINPFE